MTEDSAQVSILSIGYGNDLFRANTTEHRRLVACAEEMREVHTLVLGASAQKARDGKLFLYGVGGSLRLMKLLRACHVGLKICRSAKSSHWVVTAQDPFETALIGYVISWFCGRKLVIQEHGDFFSGPYWAREALLNRVRYHFGLFLLRRAWRVRVVSERIKKTLVLRGVNAERISVFPVVTDMAAFLQAAPDTSIRSLFPPDAVIVLAASRFVAQKNISLLLRACARARKSNPRLRLLLVGSGGLEQNIQNEIQELGLVDFVKRMPWTHSLPSLMKSVDVFALTSNYEGWGRVLVEAIAAGLPTVTTDVGCVGEFFIHNRHGVVVSVGDVNAFAEALVLLTTDVHTCMQFRENSHQDAQLRTTQLLREYAQTWASVFTV